MRKKKGRREEWGGQKQVALIAHFGSTSSRHPQGKKNEKEEEQEMGAVEGKRAEAVQKVQNTVNSWNARQAAVHTAKQQC